jgi:glutamate synthase (ferredoxin)
MYINGKAGERFAVRNSGANTVVEGIGDHGCEYMTGGRVVVLGEIGKNFAAGMSGGIAYILDQNDKLKHRINQEMVDLESFADEKESNEIKTMVENYVKYTGSEGGAKILEDWENLKSKFIKVMPKDYKRVLAGKSRIKDEQDVSA